ncbi:TetR/AcrR family transcriptional regulator [Telluria aromaticivorans]|uniref:TetR/AcrR family transcriptional regulator n=1 Tax=Telluria aromaticivorans TaxID=2725995 RepID=A0A7Y2JV56_9BURK|nr:TetR/AcrR family transcriptional regulator [Telluria aromaticivorans]NNG21592.1 TetR/AcrR family transcriptional regulator [Telluria aromaticivorans]
MKAELTTTRSYRGLSQDERRAERRSRLMAAAIAVYGERGYHQATVKAVCEQAGLTERYFYESFANSEALLIDSFNAVAYSVLGEITRAAEDAGRGRIARSRAMLHAYFAALQREPQSARVFLVEIRGVSRAVDLAFDGALRAIGREVARIAAPPGAPHDELLQAGVVGGVIHIALRWIEDGYLPEIDAVADSALTLGAVLATARRPRATLSAA